MLKQIDKLFCYFIIIFILNLVLIDCAGKKEKVDNSNNDGHTDQNIEPYGFISGDIILSSQGLAVKIAFDDERFSISRIKKTNDGCIFEQNPSDSGIEINKKRIDVGDRIIFTLDKKDFDALPDEWNVYSVAIDKDDLPEGVDFVIGGFSLNKNNVELNGTIVSNTTLSKFNGGYEEIKIDEDLQFEYSLTEFTQKEWIYLEIETHDNDQNTMRLLCRKKLQDETGYITIDRSILENFKINSCGTYSMFVGRDVDIESYFKGGELYSAEEFDAQVCIIQ